MSSVAVRSKNMGSARIMTSLNVASLAASLEVDSSASAQRAHDISCMAAAFVQDSKYLAGHSSVMMLA